MTPSLSPAERLVRASWDLFWIPSAARVLDNQHVLAIGTPGWSATYNAVFRVPISAAACGEALDSVRSLHTPGPSRWHLIDTDRAIEPVLEAAGYAPTQMHDTRVVAIGDFVPRARTTYAVKQVVDRAMLRDANVVSEDAFGNDGVGDEDDELALFTDPARRSRFFVCYDDGGAPISAGGLNIYADLGIGFLWGGGTVGAARGRGAYSAVLAARIAFAAKCGLRHVGTYARVESSSPIVAAAGFERVGQMAYWERTWASPASTPSMA